MECEAVRWDGTVEAATSIINWMAANDGTASYVDPYLHSPSCRCDGRGIVPGPMNPVRCPETEPTGDTYLAVHTMDPAIAKAFAGDYIVRGIEGEFYPARASVFEASHEPV